MMDIGLVNDGPVTILLDSRKKFLRKPGVNATGSVSCYIYVAVEK